MTSLMVTSGGGYGVLVGNWLPLGYNLGGTPGICPSKFPRNREGTRADGWTDDRRQDGHSSVSPENRDTQMGIRARARPCNKAIMPTCNARYKCLQKPIDVIFPFNTIVADPGGEQGRAPPVQFLLFSCSFQ